MPPNLFHSFLLARAILHLSMLSSSSQTPRIFRTHSMELVAETSTPCARRGPGSLTHTGIQVTEAILSRLLPAFRQSIRWVPTLILCHSIPTLSSERKMRIRSASIRTSMVDLFRQLHEPRRACDLLLGRASNQVARSKVPT